MFLRPALLSAALVFGAAAAHATPITGVYSVTVSEGLGPNGGFDTAAGNPYSGRNTASATFTYTGPIDFNNTAANNGPSKTGDQNSAFGFTSGNISNYSGSGTVASGGTTYANFNTKNSFLNSSGSANGYTYGSYYTFDLGDLAAGTILSILHDDGISLFQGSTQVGTTVSGPTTATTDTVTLSQSGDTILRYARENGTPSILQVTATAATPEPSSLALLGTGLLGLAGMVRRRMA